MADKDKKKLALAIIAGMPKPPTSKSSSKDEDEDMDSGTDPGLEAAADDLITAVRKENTDGVVEALKNFILMVDDEEEED